MLPEPSVTKATIPGGCHARGQPCAPGDLPVLLLCRAAGGSDTTTTDTTKAKGPFETRLLACHPAPSILLKSNLAISKSATATGKGTRPTLAPMVISALPACPSPATSCPIHGVPGDTTSTSSRGASAPQLAPEGDAAESDFRPTARTLR